MKTTIARSEKQIENEILTWLNLQNGVKAFKIKEHPNIRHKFIPSGISDIIGCCRGIFFALEVKTPSQLKALERKPDERFVRQVNFIHSVNNVDGIGRIVCSLEDVQKLIKNIKAAVHVTDKPGKSEKITDEDFCLNG